MILALSKRLSRKAFVYPGGYFIYGQVPYTAGGYIKLYGKCDDIIANRYYDARTVLADGGFYCFS